MQKERGMGNQEERRREETKGKERKGDIPMGTLTPTNCPFCNVGPVLGTNAPSKMPIAMARTIHMTRKRSKKLSPRRGGTSLCSVWEGGDAGEPGGLCQSVWSRCT